MKDDIMKAKYIPSESVFESLGFIWKNYEVEQGREAHPYDYYSKLKVSKFHDVFIYVDAFWDFHLDIDGEHIPLEITSDEHLIYFVNAFQDRPEKN